MHSPFIVLITPTKTSSPMKILMARTDLSACSSYAWKICVISLLCMMITATILDNGAFVSG